LIIFFSFLGKTFAFSTGSQSFKSLEKTGLSVFLHCRWLNHYFFSTVGQEILDFELLKRLCLLDFLWVLLGRLCSQLEMCRNWRAQNTSHVFGTRTMDAYFIVAEDTFCQELLVAFLFEFWCFPFWAFKAFDVYLWIFRNVEGCEVNFFLKQVGL
jgi:hypothetical protein